MKPSVGGAVKKADLSAPEAVLDASALLAHINEEPGAAVVREAMANGVSISVVNWIEVLSKLAERGEDPKLVSTELTTADLVETVVSVEPVTPEDAIEAARLRPLTREKGLSLADRACLVLGQRLSVPVLTADREWIGIGNTSTMIKLIR